MADSQVDVKDAANATASVDTRTAPDGNHRQVMVLGDPVLSDAVGTLDDGNGLHGLAVAHMATGFVFSALNSTTAQLASGATFDGTPETVINQQSVSILLVADQPCTIIVRQWIEAGTGLVSEWKYPVAQGVGFSRAFTANGNYISFHVTNNGNATTTTLNLNVAYGTLPATTNAGNAPVSLAEVNGFPLTGDPAGSVPAVEPPTTLFYEDFTGTNAVDTVWKWTTVGTAFNYTAPGAMQMPSTATSGSLTTIPAFSIQTSQYFLPAWNVRLEAGNTAATGASRFWGLATAATTPGINSLAQEGAGFQADSSGALQAVTYTGGAKTVIAVVSRPLDGLNHRYTLTFRGALTIWAVDGVEVARATQLNIATQTVSGHLSYFATGPITGTPFTQFGAFGIGDRSRLHTYIADPLFPWRRTQVTDPSTIPGAGLQGNRNDQSWGPALNVNPNAIQKATYRVNVKPVARASTADTFLPMVAVYHLASSLKTIRLRKVTISGSSSAAVGLTIGEVHRISAAGTGTTLAMGAIGGNAPRGTTGTGTYQQTDLRDPAGEAVVLMNGNTALTVTPGGLVASGQLAYSAANAVHAGNAVIYDWAASEERKPLTARAGVLEGWAIGINSIVAMTWTCTIEVSFTEE